MLSIDRFLPYVFGVDFHDNKKNMLWLICVTGQKFNA